MAKVLINERILNPSLDHKKIRKAILRYWQVYLLMVPAIVYTLIFAYGPMYGIQIAFKDYSSKKGIWGSEWVGLQHYIRFVNYPDFWRLMWNTISISLYSLATFPLPVILAIMLSEVKHTKFLKTVQMVSYMPHFISTVVVCGMVLMFLDRESGVINNAIELLGGSRTNFMADPGAFRHIYIWSGVWQGIGWSSVLYFAALSGISPELIEAARIDGATRIQMIRHVKIPTIIPTLVLSMIMSCGSILGVGFEKIFLLQNAMNLPVSSVISTYTYDIGLISGQFSYSTAIGLFNNTVNLILLFIVNFIARKGTGHGIW